MAQSQYIDAERIDIFEKRPVVSAIAAMAVPTIISQLINLIYNMADTFFIGRTGDPLMIAATSLAYSLFMFCSAFASLFGMGGGTQMARLIGVGKAERARRVCAYSIYWSLGVAAVYGLVVFLFLEPLLYLMGATEFTLLYSKQYTIQVVVIGSIPLVVSTTMSHLLRNVGYSKQASFGLSGGGLLNLLLDPLLMFVVFPKGMEVFAAALATLLSNVASLIYFTVVIFRISHKAPVSISLSDAKETDPEDRKKVFSVGLPTAVMLALFDCSTLLSNKLISLHGGDLQVAANGMVHKIIRLPIAIDLGISQGMAPIVAYNYAAGNEKRMKQTMNTSRLIGLGVAACGLLFYQLCAEQIIRVFISTGNEAMREQSLLTIEYAVYCLRWRSLSSPLTYVNSHTSYSLQAMGYGMGTLIISVIRHVVTLMPLMVILDHLMGWKGIPAAMPLAELLTAVFAVSYLIYYLKKISAEIRSRKLKAVETV